jgi:sirohydrochlorin cobaltochelatase
LGVHARLVELADMRVQGTLATAASSIPVSETSLLVVGRGSSDAGANSEIARLAYLMGQAREYLSTGYAFHAVASPGVAQALRLCRLLGARQVVVMPFLLFTGRVHEEIGAMALQCGGELGLRVHVAGYLGTHTLSLDVAGQRIDEAAKGIAAINCDLCRYRFAV